MIPVYDYWDWYALIHTDDSWRYFHPEDDYETSLHYDSLHVLVGLLAEDECDRNGVEGVTVEIVAMPSKGGPIHKIYVDLESWCRHYEPEFLA